jgi:hypothetical protein
LGEDISARIIVAPLDSPTTGSISGVEKGYYLFIRVGSPPKKRMLFRTQVNARMVSCRPIFTVGKSFPPSKNPRIPTMMLGSPEKGMYVDN